MGDRSFVRRLTVPLVALGSLFPARAQEARSFRPLRAPLYGLTIEHDAERDVYRLLEGRGTTAEEVLLTGKRDACESYMIELLKRKYPAKWNVKMPTLGSRQFWGDEFVFAGWRIQQNVFTGHHRLLDPTDSRHAWGSYEACRVAFEEQRFKRRLTRASDHVVVLVHGLGRSRASFRKLAAALRKDGYEVVGVNYPSTRKKIEDHAAQIARVLGRIEGMKRVSFVTHSMGALVVRELLARPSPWRAAAKVGRLVMLAPPNRGSVLADKLKDVLPYKLVAGAAGQDLATERIQEIPVPTCEFGVIAGGTGKAKGLNPMIEGDNDGLVAVRNTKLDGMKDFLLVRSLHTVIMDRPQTIDATRRFLATGKFR